MPFIETLGMQLGLGTAGAGITAVNNAMEAAQARRLQELQLQGNKEALNQLSEKELEMWRSTSYGAQVNEMKKAGLSPGLIYGMGGGGGQTVGGNASVTAPGRSGNNEIMGMMQMGMMNAQKENIEADTQLKKAEAANKPIQGENIAANTSLINVNKGIQELEAQIKEASLNDTVDIIRNKRNQMESEAKILLNNKKISDATYKTEIEKINVELATSYVEKALTEAQIPALKQRVQNETDLKNNKIVDDMYYRMIHDVSDSLDLTVNSAADLLRIALGFFGIKSKNAIMKKRPPTNINLLPK